MFGTKVGIDPNLDKTAACPDISYFQIKTKKSQVWKCGSNLEVPIFGYLDILMEKQEAQPPTEYQLKSLLTYSLLLQKNAC